MSMKCFRLTINKHITQMYFFFWHVTNQSASCLLATYYFDEEYSNITYDTKKAMSQDFF